MSAIKSISLKRKLWLIVFISFISRVVILIFLPNYPTTFASDEGTYASLSKWIADVKPASNFPGFGEGLYLSGRAIIIPASLLIRLGFYEIDAIRVVSMIYSLATLIITVLFTLRFFKLIDNENNNKNYNEKLAFFLITIFAFIPSHFIWSNLGLREAGIEFWLICAFISTFFVFYRPERTNWLALFTFGIAILFVFSSRPQVGWLLSVTLIIFTFLKIKSRTNLIFLPLLIIGIAGGNFLTTPSNSIFVETYSVEPLKSQVQDVISKEVKDEAVKKCLHSGMVLIVKNYLLICKKTGEKKLEQGIKNPASVAIEQIQGIPMKQEANQLGAASKINPIWCPIDGPNLENRYGCLLWRAPYAALTFLFRPFPFLDTTSTTSHLASIENLVWLGGILVLVGLIVIRKRFAYWNELIPSVIFLVLYVFGAGSYEGNMGTAFRHKSTILWIVLTLIFSILFRQPDEQPKIQKTNSEKRFN